MASKPLTQFPAFAPPPPAHHRPATEVRFSRWNNANAEKFIRRERTQKEIEDQLRLHKRLDSALNIATNFNPAPPAPVSETFFKSIGTPSLPSKPSIPGKSSKYSKNQRFSHPAFKPVVRPRKIPAEIDRIQDGEPNSSSNSRSSSVKIDENGVSYEFPEAPFVYQYSYTESPKVKPLKLREPPVSPFGPETMARPWTGRKPLPPSKKKLPEFDSFQLPPPHKKGVKPVQSPGPFLPGSGPKYVRSREEVLGEPLNKEEIEDLIRGCNKSSRQLNMGRDGLTHNMLENIHAHWKRKRVCKIKCKGVCTVDMENVREKLEEKTGGKVIYARGGVIYLFRGRNYNYKTRPRFPLMLWRPSAPVYPKLIKRIPEGLTLEEVTEMRDKGRNLTPICKLAKNGVYCDLVKNVREAFEACELVRINCQGLNASDYKKIGGKLKDLVPCVLISFEQEHILMRRGKDWKSSLPEIKDEPGNGDELEIDNSSNGAPLSVNQPESPSASNASNSSDADANPDNFDEITPSLPGANAELDTSKLREEEAEDLMLGSEDALSVSSDADVETIPGESPLSEADCTGDGLNAVNQTGDRRLAFNGNLSEPSSMTNDSWSPSIEGVLQLRKQAIENGSAIVLDDSSLDADIVYERAVALAKSALSGPVFKRQPKRPGSPKIKNQETGGLEAKESTEVQEKVISVTTRKESERKIYRKDNMKDIRGDYLNVVPQGGLRVDELAKLLA